MGDTELGVGGGPGGCLISLHQPNPNPGTPNRSFSPAGTHFLRVTCDQGHSGVTPVGALSSNVEAMLPSGASLLGDPMGTGKGRRTWGTRIPLVVLEPLTQVGDVIECVEFIQCVTPLPRLSSSFRV